MRLPYHSLISPTGALTLIATRPGGSEPGRRADIQSKVQGETILITAHTRLSRRLVKLLSQCIIQNIYPILIFAVNWALLPCSFSCRVPAFDCDSPVAPCFYLSTSDKARSSSGGLTRVKREARCWHEREGRMQRLGLQKWSQRREEKQSSRRHY